MQIVLKELIHIQSINKTSHNKFDLHAIIGFLGKLCISFFSFFCYNKMQNSFFLILFSFRNAICILFYTNPVWPLPLDFFGEVFQWSIYTSYITFSCMFFNIIYYYAPLYWLVSVCSLILYQLCSSVGEGLKSIWITIPLFYTHPVGLFPLDVALLYKHLDNLTLILYTPCRPISSGCSFAVQTSG